MLHYINFYEYSVGNMNRYIDYHWRVVTLLITKCLQVASSHKLPALYLIDSVIKNISEGSYLHLFTKNIVNIFVLVFEQVLFMLVCYLMNSGFYAYER